MTPKPLKFLVVSPTPTWPLDHGNRKRVHQICSGFKSAGHEVHFVYYPAEQDWLEAIPHGALAVMRQQWAEVYIAPLTRRAHSAPKGAFHGLDEWWDPALEDYLNWLFGVDRFDAIVVNYVWLSRALEMAPKQTLRVLDTHDRVSDRKGLLTDQGLAPEFFYTNEDMEIEGLNRADVVIAIKEQEADHFGRLCAGDTNVINIPYFEESHPLDRDTAYSEIPRFGILAAKNSLNRLSTQNLIDSLEINGVLDDLRCKIVIGGSLSDDFSVAAGKNISVLGRFDDIQDFYINCDVVVVPLAASTGQKVRVGEALAFGMPIICHSHAFEGYIPFHEMNQINTVDEIAKSIKKAIADPSIIKDLRNASEKSQRQQRNIAESGIQKIIDLTNERNIATCFYVDIDLLSASADYTRLMAAIRAANTAGPTVTWLHLDQHLQDGARERIHQLSNTTILSSTPSDARTLHKANGREVDVSILHKQSFESLLEDIRPDVLWTPSAGQHRDFGGITILDGELRGSTKGGGSQCQSVTIWTQDRNLPEPNGPQTEKVPFFLGHANFPLWRAATSRSSAWIVSPGDASLEARVAQALSRDGQTTVVVWRDALLPQPCALNCESEMQFLDRTSLRSKLDRPSVGFILYPRAISDTLPLELLAQAAAPCIILDPANSERARRHAFEVGDEEELFQLIAIWNEAQKVRGRVPAFGQKLSFEPFSYFDFIDKFRSA